VNHDSQTWLFELVFNILSAFSQTNTLKFELTFATLFEIFSYLRHSVAEAKEWISQKDGEVKQTINNWK
jgi:hypothetical protein